VLGKGVAMDGSKALFKIVLNSRKSQDIPHKDLIPGTAIIIQPEDYKFVCMLESESMMRAVLLVDTFDFDPVPRDESRSTEDKQSTVTPKFSMC
jgi:hypothetical protein